MRNLLTSYQQASLCRRWSQQTLLMPPRVVCSILSGRAVRIDDIRPFPTSTNHQEDVQVSFMAREAD